MSRSCYGSPYTTVLTASPGSAQYPYIDVWCRRMEAPDARYVSPGSGNWRHRGGPDPRRARRDQGVFPGNDRATTASQPDPDLLADRHGRMDLWRRPAAGGALDCVGLRPALDRRDDV